MFADDLSFSSGHVLSFIEARSYVGAGLHTAIRRWNVCLSVRPALALLDGCMEYVCIKSQGWREREALSSRYRMRLTLIWEGGETAKNSVALGYYHYC